MFREKYEKQERYTYIKFNIKRIPLSGLDFLIENKKPTNTKHTVGT